MTPSQPPHQPPPLQCMIVGAQKAGTTSLKNYLGQHPSITTHLQTEMSYFVDDHEYETPYPEIISRYFGAIGNPSPLLLAKNASLVNYEKGLQRLKTHNPHCHIIFSLRDPVERAYSSYLLEYELQNDRHPFPEAVRIALNDRNNWRYWVYLEKGLYWKYYQQLCQYFPASQVSLVLFEKLTQSPRQVCRQIFRALSLDDTFLPDVRPIHNPSGSLRSPFFARLLNKFLLQRNPLKTVAKGVIPHQQRDRVKRFIRSLNKKSGDRPQMDPKTRQQLIDFYKPENQQLQQEFDLDLSGWSG